jgi:thiamine biosynthesis lipoprotein
MRPINEMTNEEKKAELKRHTRRSLLWVLVLLIATTFILYRHHTAPTVTYQYNSGLVFGTVYHATYPSDTDLHQELIDELRRFDNSLSTFNPNSVISRVNRNEDVVTDTLFQNVFRRAMEISAATDGAFDITVAPLVNAWGFGFKQEQLPDSAAVDSLRALIGYRKATLDADGRVRKTDDRVMLDCASVAKGYASDVIAAFLQRKGVDSYMVEIGGEVVLKGQNPEGGLWRIGINKPVEDSLAVNQGQQLILELTDCALATSGNYRNYYYIDGKKYVHTIDPRTGYPIQHDILSATVIADDCMTADALATAFMVMGLEATKRFCAAHPEIDVCLIYVGADGKNEIYQTNNRRHASYTQHTPLDMDDPHPRHLCKRNGCLFPAA